VKISKNIRKSLFEVEKISLLIISVVVLVNLGANGLVVLLSDAEATSYFIQQLASNITLFGFIYLMMYSINQAITAIPFLVSLNCRRKSLAKNVMFNGLTRSLFITLIIIFINAIVFAPEIGLDSVTGIIGFNISSNNPVILLTIAVIFCMLLYFIYSLTTFISLLGVKYGWEYVLTAVFIILGTCFLLFRPIVLLFIFGRQLNLFIFLVLILTAIFSLINYRSIVDFEYKY